jgi:AraC family transcriptional regulator, arabinose operon regulatory protein
MEFTYLPEILSSGDLEFDPSWALRPHSSGGTELLHVVSGTLELLWEESGERFTAEAGQTLFNPPGVVHRDNFDFDSGLQILIIQFKWKHFEDFFEAVNNSNINNICNATSAQLKRLFDDIKLDSGPGENDRQLAGARLMHILMLFYREQATENYAANEFANTEGCRHRIVEAAKKYLDKNYHHPVRLEDVANELEISTFYLSRLFSSQSDFSLFQYLTDVRMNEAKKLLRKNRHIINDIALMVGFESLSYFSKVFKKNVGCSPSQYGKIKKT